VLSPLLFIIYIADIPDIHLPDGSMTIYIDDINAIPPHPYYGY